jgi:hypothetical protein
MPIKKITVAFEFPLSPIKLSADWEPGEQEREAAWEMYVELVTRVAVVELPTDRGLVREALSSYYSLFATTREILKKYGPKVARPQGKGSTSFGQLAIVILNELLRPFLTEWHPALQDWETGRGAQESTLAHERAWGRHGEIREALESTRVQLGRYAGYLAEVAGVPATLATPAR